MNVHMNNLYTYLMKPLTYITPERTIQLLSNIRKSYPPVAHTHVNAEFIVDEIENLWEEGCLTHQMLALLSTNVIYDAQKVIELRKHVSRFTSRYGKSTVEQRPFGAPRT